MKKFLLVFACVFMVVTVSAQTLGIKAGYNGSKISFNSNSTDLFDDMFDDKVNNKINSGFYIGAFTTFELSDKFVLQPELVYSSQGATLKVKETSYWLKTNVNTHYLNIPVIAKYEVIDGLYVNAGPQFGFLLGDASVRAKWNIAGEKDSSEKGSIDREYLNAFDFAIALGLEYEITESINVSLRYNIGLTNTYEDEKSKSNVLQIGLEYKLFTF